MLGKDDNFAKIVTPTRTLFFRRLEDAFAHSDIMVEEHRVYAKDALSDQYVLVGTRWMPDCADQQEDTCGGIVETSNQWR